MAPEDEARARVLYDHESDEPRRRRHAVADWGVGEDIFDRMPSRRFIRSDRRAEHRAAERAESRGVHERAERRRGERRPAESWFDEETDAAAAAGAQRAVALDGGEAAEGARTIVVETGETAAGAPRTIVIETDDPVAAGDDAPEPAMTEPPARRTVVISGHPDRLPAPRHARAARTAAERIGARPDRIVAYAVALGFLLVLLAVLTTGQ